MWQQQGVLCAFVACLTAAAGCTGEVDDHGALDSTPDGAGVPDGAPPLPPIDADVGLGLPLLADGANSVAVAGGTSLAFQLDTVPGEHASIQLTFAGGSKDVELVIERDGDAVGSDDEGSGLRTLALLDQRGPARFAVKVVAGAAPELMTLALMEDEEGLVERAAVEQVLAVNADVIAVGPGLGRSPGVSAFVHALVEKCGVPLVLDADALIAFAGDASRLVGRDGADVIVTPHPGEMAALIGGTVDDVQADRVAVAGEFATSHHVTVVLKGHRTLVASPDGRIGINLTGNPGMATAGTGDVLTGMLAALMGQMLDAEAACRLAVYLHGLAGDLAESDEGEMAVTARDLIARLGEAVLELTARRKPTARQ